MTLRVACRLARVAVSAQCSRCLLTVDVAPGEWLAVERDDPALPVCDACAERGDLEVFAQLEAWRRASHPTRRAAS